MDFFKGQFFKGKFDKGDMYLEIILVVAIVLSLLPPTFKVITVLVTVIICFFNRKKSVAAIKNRFKRINDFISLNDTEYRRLKFLLDSDCKLTDLICAKKQNLNSESASLKSPAKSQTGKIKVESADVKGDVEKWYSKNHEKIEQRIAELSEQDVFTCQLQLLAKLPSADCWQALCKKLSDEWNVTCDICGDELHISWFQI